MNLCSKGDPGLPPPPVPGSYWKFVKPENRVGHTFTVPGDSTYHTAELYCGDANEIQKRCGDAGLAPREKRTMFCANDKWISGADTPPRCACNKHKGDGKKSKDKHNKDKKGKPNKKQKQKDHPNQDGQSAGAYGPSGTKGGKTPTKHKKNKH